MKKPRISMRLFFVLCLLLGAVVVPVGWRQYQKWKADMVETLEKELAELRTELRMSTSGLAAAIRVYAMTLATDPKAKAAHDQKVAELRQRITRLEDRLEELTGVHSKTMRKQRQSNLQLLAEQQQLPKNIPNGGGRRFILATLQEKLQQESARLDSREARKDRSATKWKVLGELNLIFRTGEFRVGLYWLSGDLGAFSMGRTATDRVYYRGGTTAAFVEVLNSAYDRSVAEIGSDQ